MADKKTCYIISEIGEPESEERKWADFVREHIITPAITACGYKEPARADDPDKDLIMADIIEQMFEADLVIADLTRFNPNVFYELGIRHCAQKPAIHLIKIGQSPPFDLGGNKAIFIDRDHEKVIEAKSEIERRIKAIEEDPGQFYSQVQQHIQYKELELFKKSQTGKDKLLFEVLATLARSTGRQLDMIGELHEELVLKPKQTPPRFVRGALTRASFLASQQEPPEAPLPPQIDDEP
jgi:nucleoside 2-deoxyribosyltransferase